MLCEILAYSKVVCAQLFSHVWCFATPWTTACQAPLSLEFSSKNTGVGCHPLLQGIFPTQGLNPGLLYCRQIFYHLSHQEVQNQTSTQLNRTQAKKSWDNVLEWVGLLLRDWEGTGYSRWRELWATAGKPNICSEQDRSWGQDNVGETSWRQITCFQC